MLKIMSAIFLNHGGGPLPLLGDPAHAKLIKYLSKAASSCPRPKAILIASAHWEEPVTTFIGSEDPGLLYDYNGFTPESYEIKYPARNSLAVVKSATALLERAGIQSRVDSKRKYDHGVFVPLKLMFPEANIPVVQMSLPASRDPAFVYRLGEVLAPLRKEGVLILGSGLSFHNLSGFFSSDSVKRPKSTAFDSAVKEAMLSGSRKEQLINWRSFPHEDTLMGAKISGFAFHSTLEQEL